MNLALDPDHADELADLLSLLEDWLMHADDQVRRDLARFGFRAQINPDMAVQWAIDQLGEFSLTLRRQLAGHDAWTTGARR